jgi:hypothetical protein
LTAGFYCVADDGYFPGAVALINSLRLAGHREPIYLLDCGLEAGQRRVLEREATVVAAPRDAAPQVLKAIAPSRHPADVMVLIDTDMIVTRPLTELMELAAGGRVVAFENDRQRHFPEWGPLLGLGAPRRQPYVSSALVLLGEPVGGRVVELLDELKDKVDFEQTFWRRNVRDYPLLYADQDVLNGILATRVERERLVAMDSRLIALPPFDRLRLLDEDTLRCAYRDGTEPWILHHFASKPWLVPMRSSVYSRLLTRLLLAPDAPLRLDPSELPLRLRTGRVASAARAITDIRLVGPGVARRLRERRARTRARAESMAP